MTIQILEPVPAAPETEAGMVDWAKRLVAWILHGVVVESDLEEILSLGGAELGARIFGFEKVLTGYAPTSPAPLIVLTAPVAPTKVVVVSITLSSAAASGTAREFRIYKKKGATEHNIFMGITDNNTPFTAAGNIRITLDDDDEELWFEATTGTEDLHITGSMILLD